MSSRLLGSSFLLLVLAAFTLPMIAPSQQPSRTAVVEPRWEYKVVRTENSCAVSENGLNTLGQQGWELVGFDRSAPAFPKDAEGTLLIVPAATGPNKDITPQTADSFQGKLSIQMAEAPAGTCFSVFKRLWHPLSQQQ
jgi:hypothetical protein